MVCRSQAGRVEPAQWLSPNVVTRKSVPKVDMAAPYSLPLDELSPFSGIRFFNFVPNQAFIFPSS